MFLFVVVEGARFFAVVAGAFFLLLLLGAFVVAVVAVPGAFFLLSLRFPAVKKTRREAQRQQKKVPGGNDGQKINTLTPGSVLFLLTLREPGFTHSLAS